jgi:hypothetical protein
MLPLTTAQGGAAGADFQRKVLSSHQAALVKGGGLGAAAAAGSGEGEAGGDGEDGAGGLWSSLTRSGLMGLLEAAEEEAGALAAAAAAAGGGATSGEGDDLRGVVR